MDFRSAVKFCIAKNIIHDGPGNNVMPIGKLRNLKNNFDPNPEMRDRIRIPLDVLRGRKSNYDYNAKYRSDYTLYRVNGVKSPDGEWREYPSGKLIDFHHFPGFDPEKGSVGDTLAWNIHENDLVILGGDVAKFKALCSRPMEKKSKPILPIN